MIVEHAVLEVDPTRTAAFEAAFAEAKRIIAAAEGFLSLRLSRCLERPGRYLLLVEWETLDDHVVGFRGSDAYPEWRRLLHHYYDPMPEVTHFAVIETA